MFLAAFATFFAFRKPSESQWGYIQTLADLIDDWHTSRDSRLWWGDKGVGADGIRHAGTAGDRNQVGTIAMNALYAGTHEN
jgi:hypothetical protein